jgi:hypothetical protein
VLDHDQGQLVAEGEQEVGDELPLAAREPRARLVEHHQLRLGGERDPECDLALLAVRERADDLRKLVVDRDPARRLTGALANLAVALEHDRSNVSAADADDREIDAVLDGEPGEETRLLIGAREPHLRPRARRSMRDVAAEQLDRPRGGGEVAADDVEEGRLARPVRAEDGAPLAGGHLEVDLRDGVEAAEAPADPPQAEGRLGVFGECRFGQAPTSGSGSSPCRP